MNRLHRAYSRLLVPAIALLALAALTACGGSGDGAGGGGTVSGEEISLTGNWSGTWTLVDGGGDPQGNGAMSGNFTDNGDTTVSGTATVDTLCGGATDLNITTGALDAVSFTFTLVFGGNTISFTTPFPEDPISGTYAVTTGVLINCESGWSGTFTLSKA